MSGAVPWKLLQDQYTADSIYETEITKLIVSPEEVTSKMSTLIMEIVSSVTST